MNKNSGGREGRGRRLRGYKKSKVIKREEEQEKIRGDENN